MKSVTEKQVFTLKCIASGHVPGAELLDFDTLLTMLPWRPSKQSMQFTIRSLIKRGLIEKGELQRRKMGRGYAHRRVYKLTPAGVYELGSQPGASTRAVLGEIGDLDALNHLGSAEVLVEIEPASLAE